MKTWACMLTSIFIMNSGFAIDMVVGEVHYRVPVSSVKALKSQAILIQQYDFSCGSAALATLLTYHYDFPVTEQSIFEEMFAVGDQNKIKQQGFSLLDMKQYLGRHGYIADGFNEPLSKLVEAKVPAIVLITENGYNHFVVIKGLRGDRILLGDPATGNKVMSLHRFTEIWKNKLLFVIHNKMEMVHFDASKDWSSTPLAPLGRSDGRELQLTTLQKMGPGDF